MRTPKKGEEKKNLKICFRPSRAVADVSSSSKARSNVGTISSMACSPALYKVNMLKKKLANYP